MTQWLLINQLLFIMNNTQRSYLDMHIAVFLFGFTAILGGLIQLPSLMLVWWRVLITAIAIFTYGDIVNKLKILPRSIIYKLLGNGGIVALHWLTFFGSVKLANVSVALVTFATTSFLSSLIEPLMTKQRVKGYEVILGIFIVPAMILIVGGLPKGMIGGFIVGLVSALLAVVFSVINKKNIQKAPPLSIMFLNMSGGWILLSVIVPFYLYFDTSAIFLPSTTDWIYLVILALVCTNLGYFLSVRALRHISAFTSNLIVNLETVYGILLAWLILNEDKQLTPSFYLGAILIIISVFSYPFIKNRFMTT